MLSREAMQGSKPALDEREDPLHCSARCEPGSSDGRSTWGGQTGNLGYLAKMFPRISETFILREVRALQRHGIPVRIYSLLPPTRDARIHAEAELLAATVEVLPQPGWSNWHAFLADLLTCLRARPGATGREVMRSLLRPRRRSFRRFSRAVSLAVRLRRDRVAHLHAAWAHTPASVARIACRLAGIPWSMGAHAKDIHLSKRSSLAKKMAAARFTLTCTRSNQKLLEEIGALRQAGPLPAAVLLHYHGVDTTYFSPAAEVPAKASDGAHESLILSVGRLVPKKGFDLLIGAAALLRDRGVPFRMEIVGEGALRGALERQIRSLALEEMVVLRGMLVWEEVRSAYARATCMALASRVTPDGDRDGIANTLAEAMACGVPVVATRLPSIQEIIIDGETGLLVPAEDEEALADALESLLQNPSQQHSLGGVARQWICREFDERHWGAHTAARLKRSLGIEHALYVTADRGVPVRGSKGASVHVRSVVRAMRDLGVDPVVLTTRRGPTDGPQIAAPTVETGTRGGWRRFLRHIARWTGGGSDLERALMRLADNLFIYREARRQAKAAHADLIYERYSLNAFAGSLLARHLGIPHILEVNAPLADEEARFRGLRLGALTRWMEGWILRRADRVVVVSRALEIHARGLGVKADRIAVLPNAVDPLLFRPDLDGVAVRERYGLNGSFVVGFSGTLKPWHGLHHLLGALAKMAAGLHETHLLIVGDGPGRGGLERLAGELGLAGRVHFAGTVAHEDVGEFLAACDVLAAPYGPLESFWFSPLKLMEYLAVGRPVVASAIGQIEELAGRSPGVVLVPPGDEESLARCLHALAGDPERRQQLARAAASSAVWTWRDLVRKVLTIGEAARREIWGWER